MKRLIKGTVALAGAFLVLSGASALRADGPAINGFVDTTYNYNFNKPQSGQTALRSFDAQANNFNLNAAQLAITGAAGDANYVIKLLAGSDALLTPSTGLGLGSGSSFDLEEAYVNYKNSKTLLGLKMGKFVSFEGIEVVESKDNPTISRGLLFGLAEPYSHVGGVATYNQGGKIEGALGLVNGWDVAADNNNGKTAIGRVGFNLGDPLTVGLSGSYGPEQAQVHAANASSAWAGNNRTSVDLTGVMKIFPKTALNFQGNWGQEHNAVNTSDSYASWRGFGIQPVYSVSDKFSVGARYEYFADPSGVRTATPIIPTVINVAPSVMATDVVAQNITITPAYKLTTNTTVRAEYRYDRSNKEIFQNDKGIGKKSNNTGSFEVIYAF